MLTAMVAGLYETNEMYTVGTEFYTEVSFSFQDMCPHPLGAFHGPATVRMVSNNSTPPFPMPVQVPPGHLVQQIVDETGTLRHIILSPQPPMAVPVASPYSPNPTPASASTAGTPSFYPYPYPHPSHSPFHPHSHTPHMQPSPTPPQGLTSHATLHPHQCSNHNTHPGPPPSPISHPHFTKDERTQRQFNRLKKKLDARFREGNNFSVSPQAATVMSPKKDNLSASKDQNVLVHNSIENHVQEDECENPFLTEFLSTIKPPAVSDVAARSALLQWKSPDLCVYNGVIKSGDSENIESSITYQVLLSEKGKESKCSVVYSGRQTECKLMDLKPATEYYVCVQAVVDDFRGNPAATTFETLSCEPDAPLPPRLSNRTKTSLVLKWNATPDNGSKITSYILEYDEGQGSANFVEIFSGLQKQYKLSRLNASTCYRFRLAAVNANGKSQYSEVVCYSTSGTAPSQPPAPTLKQAFVDQLHLEWQQKPNDDDFTLQMEDEATHHGFLNVYSGPETSYVCTSLRRNSEYRFRLAARNEEGTSPWSKIVAYRTLPARPDCPSKPQSKGRTYPTSFRVTWDAPRDTGGSEITKYTLEIDDGSGFRAIYTGHDTDYTCEHLLPGTTYRLRVCCSSSAGMSPYSETASITTAAICPGRCLPPRLLGKPKSLSLHLKWAPPDSDGGSPVTDYEVNVTNPDGTSRRAYKGSDSDCIVAGLLPGRPYQFTVRAHNRVGAGPWSNPLDVVSGAGPPDPPPNVSLSCHSSNSIVVSWDEPESNGAPILEYYLEWRQEDKESSMQVSVGNCLRHEVRGLFPATRYQFQVQAANSAGTGPHSEIVSGETPASSPAAVSASSVQVECSATSLTLSWEEPNSNGAEILNYNVELGDQVYSTEGSEPHICIEDLIPETTYRLRIQAVNSKGPGPFSSTLKITTQGLPPIPPNLICIMASHNSLKLKWGEGRNLSLTQFILEMENKNGSFVPIYQGIGLNHKVNKLQEMTTYRFRICAANDAGNGPYSEVYAFQTIKAPPPALKAPRVCCLTDSSCDVEWDPTKPMGEDSILYVLQLCTTKESEYKVIYRGPNVSFSLDGLEPHTEYSVRVAAARQSLDSSPALMGAFSATTKFTTLCKEPPVRVTTSKSSIGSSLEEKHLTDQQWAFILLCSFTFFAIVGAILIEHFLSYN